MKKLKTIGNTTCCGFKRTAKVLRKLLWFYFYKTLWFISDIKHFFYFKDLLRSKKLPPPIQPIRCKTKSIRDWVWRISRGWRGFPEIASNSDWLLCHGHLLWLALKKALVLVLLHLNESCPNKAGFRSRINRDSVILQCMSDQPVANISKWSHLIHEQ